MVVDGAREPGADATGHVPKGSEEKVVSAWTVPSQDHIWNRGSLTQHSTRDDEGSDV